MTLVWTQEQENEQQQFDAFAGWLREARTPTVLRHIADLMEGRTDPAYGTAREPIRIFAEANGWTATIRTVANVMQLDEHFKRELMDRR